MVFLEESSTDYGKLFREGVCWCSGTDNSGTLCIAFRITNSSVVHLHASPLPNMQNIMLLRISTAAVHRNTLLHSSEVLLGARNRIAKGINSIVTVIPSDMLPVTKWLYCFEISGADLKNPPVAAPSIPALAPSNNIHSTLLALLLANAKAIKTVAEPKNAIELNRRSFVLSVRNLILSEINPAQTLLMNWADGPSAAVIPVWWTSKPSTLLMYRGENMKSILTHVKFPIAAIHTAQIAGVFRMAPYGIFFSCFLPTRQWIHIIRIGRTRLKLSRASS